VRDEVAQKVMISLEMTDRVMERIYHPSRELAPCWSHLQKWEMMGGEGETFSNPSASARPVGFKGIPCMLAQLPLPQCGWCTPHGLYLHLTAVPVIKLVSLTAARWAPQLFSEHSNASERTQENIRWSIQDSIGDDLEPAAVW